MSSALRPYDAVGRYGGEEFLVIMPGCDTTEALIVSERLRTLFDENPIVSSEGILHVRLSLGAVVIKGKNRLNTDSVVKSADDALYRAKNLGRNRVEFSGEF
jgi:two-component system, cell cycle response regulator